MLFVDHAQVTVKAGDGGRGCPSFAQPPYTRYPYPDGGDGGRGGNVVLVADPNVATLLDFQFRHEFAADRGGHGGSNTKAGANGGDLIIRVPMGTVILDAGSGAVLCDLTKSGEPVIIAKGGRSGLGNAETLEAQPGGRGEERLIRLELKLIADVGLIGFPNAGKSSLLARISTAHPKVANYPFTTRYPVLGVVRISRDATFVACDIPGLIEGAHEGKGLGIQFLQHIERTRLLVHVIDLAGVDGQDPVDAFRKVNAELAAYSTQLSQRPQLIAANKLDLPEARENLERFEREAGARVWPISCATGKGIPELIQAMWIQLQSVAAG